jgi:hypothetical protein
LLDPCPNSVSSSSNPISANIPVQSNPQTVQNQNDEDEQWHMDINDDTYRVNIEKILEYIDVENIICK